MKNSIAFWCLLALTVFISSCGSHSVRSTLCDVATYMEAKPDSALVVLRSISDKKLNTCSLRAYYALLHSQALDKCYIDLQTDSVIAPAVRYYKFFGSSDNRLKMYYYRARIFENSGDLEASMSWLIEGERFASKCSDLKTVFRLLSKKSQLYYYQFDWQSSLENTRKAETVCLALGDTVCLASSMIDEGSCLMMLDNCRESFSVLSEVREYWDCLPMKVKAAYYEKMLPLVLNVCPSDAIAIWHQCREEVDESLVPWLKGADICFQEGLVDSLRLCLERYIELHPAESNSQTYLLRLSKLYDLEGNYQAAYRTYLDFNKSYGDTGYYIREHNVRYVEDNYYHILLHQRDRLRISLLGTVAIITIILFLILFNCILADYRSHQAEHRKLVKLAESLKREKESLEQSLNDGVILNKDLVEIAESRLSLLNTVLTAKADRLSSTSVRDLMSSIASDYDGFLRSMSLIFSLNHEAFSGYLRSRGLSEKEIGLCSLLLNGRSVKEIGALLNSSSLYNTFHIIRKKLELDDSDPKLAIYLQGKLTDFEGVS